MTTCTQKDIAEIKSHLPAIIGDFEDNSSMSQLERNGMCQKGRTGWLKIKQWSQKIGEWLITDTR